MPNVLPTDIKKFKEAVDWFLKQTDYPATKVKILVELYQATSPLYPKGEEFQGDTGVSGGICQGMALEWIKKNSTIGGDDAFRTSATTDWESFTNAQINIKHHKLTLKLMTAELQQRQLAVQSGLKQIKVDEAYGKETGAMASVKHLVSPPKTNIELNQATSLLGKEQLAIVADAKNVIAYGDEMYAKRVLETGNPAQSFAKVAKGLVLSQVVAAIQNDQGSQPAFYMMNVNVSADKGHSLGIHAAAAPRLLDANSCEFSIDSMTTLYAFLTDYWQIYERCGFAAAKVEIFRFNV